MADKTVLHKIALGSGLGGNVFHLIGLATPYWFLSLSGHAGLWKFCPFLSDNCSSLKPLPGWLSAAQAFAILGFLSGVTALALSFLYMFVEQMKTNKVYIAAILGNFVAAGCIILTLGIAASNTPDSLIWSIGLSVMGMLLHGPTGLLMAINWHNNKQNNNMQ